MSYSEEEIKKYLNILSNYKIKIRRQSEYKQGGEFPTHKCKHVEEYLGQHLCIECGKLKGHILGKFDINDCDRLHYQKKSIYHRKYYFDKKVKNISKLINLNDEEKCELYEKLLKIDNNIMKLINKKYSRKRMININYVIKKILEEMGCEKYKNIKNKISPQILEIYDNWWKSYKELLE